MSKYNPNKISYDKQEKLLNEFCASLSELKTSEEIKYFLKDLMNRQERMMFVRRLQIAEFLTKGCTYEKIRQILGVSETTIARVARWLNFGRNGYKLILERKVSKNK